MSAQWDGPAFEVLAGQAAEPAAALAQLVRGQVAGMDPLARLARMACAGVTGLLPLPTLTPRPWPVAMSPGGEQVVEGFAEQFSLDVAAISDADRDALAAEIGDQAGEFVLMVYVADWVPRVRQALSALFSTAVLWPEPAAQQVPSLWPAVEDFLGAVARLSRLDPVLTELVRLRGARQHNCRMCKSLRSATAIAAGADEAMFDGIDNYAEADFTPRQKAALSLVDAMIWQPAHLPAPVLEEVRAQFTSDEALELVLDIARNAINKVAVARGSDQAAVTDGTQTYQVRADGSIEYGPGLAAR